MPPPPRTRCPPIPSRSLPYHPPHRPRASAASRLSDFILCLQLASLLPRLARLARDSSAAASPELAATKRDADKALADLTESVAQLDDVVQAVKRDRRRFVPRCPPRIVVTVATGSA